MLNSIVTQALANGSMIVQLLHYSTNFHLIISMKMRL